MPREFTGKGAKVSRHSRAPERHRRKVAAAGMELYYHNHSFEFKKENGKYLLDTLWDPRIPSS